MKFNALLLTGLLFLSVNPGYSQDFEVPQYELNAPADYAKYEKDIIEAAKWLLATPFDEQAEKRSQVTKFIMTWVNGSPTVNVEINPTIMDFEKRNSGMMALYFAGSARFVLENNYSKDMRAKHKATLHDMIKVYKAGKGIRKDKKMDRLIKSDEEGKLDEWLAENLKINPR